MIACDALQTLEALLAPAGGGVHVVSTGLSAQRALQRRIYKVRDDGTPDDIRAAWRTALTREAPVRAIVLGVPADTGAGFVRGANQAPFVLRERLLSLAAHPYHRDDVLDAGDIRVIPHFLGDDMLAGSQIRAARAALYGDAESTLPVAPLDQTRVALTALHTLFPEARMVVVGGDHSIGWPAFAHAHGTATARGFRLGLLHFDAHTDLLAERLGVRVCFATWAYHANELLERDGRLVQVGVRASAHDAAHWEQTLGVRQIRPSEIGSRSVEDVAESIAQHWRARDVTHLYVSNDIDGTDAAFASATGTPEPDGLLPPMVRGLVQTLAQEFPLYAGDLVEVAPTLGVGNVAEPDVTIRTALDYLADLLA